MYNIHIFNLQQVYNITDYLKKHPGGSAVLVKGAGHDVSERFHAQASHRVVKGLIQDILKRHLVGICETTHSGDDRVTWILFH